MDENKKGQLSFDMAFAIILIAMVMNLCISAYNSLNDTVGDTKTLAMMDTLATSLAFQMNRAYLSAMNFYDNEGDNSTVTILLPYEELYNSTDYTVEISDTGGGMLRLEKNDASSSPPLFERKLFFNCSAGTFTVTKGINDNDPKFIVINCYLDTPVSCTCEER